MHFVYALCEPGTEEIRYIGSSSDPEARLQSHTSDSASIGMREWVASLNGAKPVLRLLQRANSSTEARALEREWIRKYPPAQLLNVLPGGEGPGDRRVRFDGIGERVFLLRKSKKLRQQELEAITGIQGGTISNIETGKRTLVTAQTAVLLARALGTTAEYLVTGEGQPNV